MPTPKITIPDDFETLRFDHKYSLERLAEHYRTTLKWVSLWAQVTLERIMAEKIADMVYDPRLYNLYRQYARLTSYHRRPRPLLRDEAFAVMGLTIEQQDELRKYMELLKKYRTDPELKKLKREYVEHYQWSDAHGS